MPVAAATRAKVGPYSRSWSPDEIPGTLAEWRGLAPLPAMQASVGWRVTTSWITRQLLSAMTKKALYRLLGSSARLSAMSRGGVV